MAKNTALDLVLAIIPSTRLLVAKVRLSDRYLADQLRRAVTSIALNLFREQRPRQTATATAIDACVC